MLFILRQAPYASSIAREAIDVILAAASLETKISLLFLDDGVFQLCSHQDPVKLGSKPLAAMLTALPLFGVESIFAAEQEVKERGLDVEHLVLPVELLNPLQIAGLLNASAPVFSF